MLTLVGDAAKGLSPSFSRAGSLGQSEAIVAAAAVAAIAGHVFSVFLGFRGGKGVATGLGVLLGSLPAATPIPLGAFAGDVRALTDRFARFDRSRVLTAPVAVAWLGYPPPAIAASVAIAFLIVAKHRENVLRLRAGTEQRSSAPGLQRPAQKGIAARDFGNESDGNSERSRFDSGHVRLHLHRSDRRPGGARIPVFATRFALAYGVAFVPRRTARLSPLET